MFCCLIFLLSTVYIDYYCFFFFFYGSLYFFLSCNTIMNRYLNKQFWSSCPSVGLSMDPREIVILVMSIINLTCVLYIYMLQYQMPSCSYHEIHKKNVPLQTSYNLWSLTLLFIFFFFLFFFFLTFFNYMQKKKYGQWEESLFAFLFV